MASHVGDVDDDDADATARMTVNIEQGTGDSSSGDATRAVVSFNRIFVRSGAMFPHLDSYFIYEVLQAAPFCFAVTSRPDTSFNFCEGIHTPILRRYVWLPFICIRVDVIGLILCAVGRISHRYSRLYGPVYCDAMGRICSVRYSVRGLFLE
jgi:hypothetical protein